MQICQEMQRQRVLKTSTMMMHALISTQVETHRKLEGRRKVGSIKGRSIFFVKVLEQQ